MIRQQSTTNNHPTSRQIGTGQYITKARHSHMKPSQHLGLHACVANPESLPRKLTAKPTESWVSRPAAVVLKRCTQSSQSRTDCLKSRSSGSATPPWKGGMCTVHLPLSCPHLAAAALGKHGACGPGMRVDGLDGGGTTALAGELDLHQQSRLKYSSPCCSALRRADPNRRKKRRSHLSNFIMATRRRAEAAA